MERPADKTSRPSGPTCRRWPTGCSARSTRRRTPYRSPGSTSTATTQAAARTWAAGRRRWSRGWAPTCCARASRGARSLWKRPCLSLSRAGRAGSTPSKKRCWPTRSVSRCSWSSTPYLFAPASSQGLAPRLYALVSVFVCMDKACSWESREAWGLHLLRFHLRETVVRDAGCQILHSAPPGVKSRSLTLAFLLVLEIGNDQASPCFEHTGDFSESLTLEASRQMMHHQGREHHIERLIGEGELLDHPNLEIDGQVAPSRFRAGTGDLLCPRVNACDVARTAHAA